MPATKKRTSAQQSFRPRYQYAMKFLCKSNIPGSSSQMSSVLPGAYRSAANIHNPTNVKAKVRSKIVFGPVNYSKWVDDEIVADGLLRIDCSLTRDKYEEKFIHGWEGFLVIQSTVSLDVVAVYTAGPRGEEVSSIDVEQVRERVLRAS